jgi:hypothetical protein
MKAQAIAYWTATGLLAAVFAFGAFGDLARIPAVQEGMQQLGYPAYFASILGVWKALGVAALLAPRLPLIKEWAYAGMFFDLSGAAASHAASGDALGKVLTPVVLIGLLVASWALRPASRRLPGARLPASQTHEPALSPA